MQKQKLKYSGCMLHRLFLSLDLKPVYHPVPESKSCPGCMTLKLKSMELKSMELKSKLCPDCMTLKLESMKLKGCEDIVRRFPKSSRYRIAG
jgi:hypothetical protein